ncbi:response regulator [Limisphaera sp. VF-2]|jgi:two-component system cell cycle response regulator|uniref:response regulator n=1 Tax=Limisphaera sp. VF-2 TaxID=3400418 RepID=UPI00176D7E65
MPVRILSVDDSKTIRILVRKALRGYDCEVLEATNGEEGLAIAAREKPDVILLDVTMPVMDGVTMLTKLKETPELRAIPVVMITAESSWDSFQHFTRLGARDYLVKPFREDELLQAVSRIVVLSPKPGGTLEPTIPAGQ